jgi:hypothetical protein
MRKSIIVLLAIAFLLISLGYAAAVDYGTDRALVSVKAGKTYTETIASGGTSSVFAIPAIQGKRGVSIRLICGANTGTVYTSFSADALVAAGTANWGEWDRGTVTGTVDDVTLGSVTGVYAESVSGEIKIEIVY